ncbi:hypothetical protein [Ornithinimicrobium kibberense]|uniref:hypothetical protein n=1 Tax=Ornithinimicrobium kibberense TaxID=282060 RepID=UPI003623E2CC
MVGDHPVHVRLVLDEGLGPGQPQRGQAQDEGTGDDGEVDRDVLVHHPPHEAEHDDGHRRAHEQGHVDPLLAERHVRPGPGVGVGQQEHRHRRGGDHRGEDQVHLPLVLLVLVLVLLGLLVGGGLVLVVLLVLLVGAGHHRFLPDRSGVVRSGGHGARAGRAQPSGSSRRRRRSR